MAIRVFNRPIKLIWPVLGLLVILLVLIGLKLWRISLPARSLYSTYSQVQTMMGNPGREDVANLLPLAQQTHQDLLALDAELRPFYGLMKTLDWLPRVGGDVAAAPELIQLGISLSHAGDTLLTAMHPVITTVLEAENIQSELLLPLALTTLQQAGPAFEQARHDIKQARATREAIDITTLSTPITQQLERLDQVLPYADLGFDLAQFGPDLLGATEPKTYLIVAQNNDELRPTGGFISAIGTLTLNQGQIQAFTFEDIYQVDDFSQPYPDAPPQLLRYMLSEIWLARDSNWSPDYPTSVETLRKLYGISRDADVDGVISVDQVALQQIVQALEPVQVAGWPEPATGENVIDLIRLSWSPEGDFSGWDPEWWRNRKNFMGDLAGSLRERVETAPQSLDPAKVLRAALNILDERHAQIWLADEAAQDWVQQRGWDGAIWPTDGDYLMVVDSNLGFNKANAAVQLSIEYEVDLQEDGDPSATLRLMHKNNSQGESACVHRPRYGADYQEIINRCYWTYLRIYVPQESHLLEATPHALSGEFLLSGQDEPAQVEMLSSEGGKSVWGTLLMVPHSQALTTTLHYSLPPNVIEKTDAGWRYRLTVQKQAGTQANRLRVVVKLPQGRRAEQIIPSPTRIADDGRLVFDLALGRDQTIDLIFE